MWDPALSKGGPFDLQLQHVVLEGVFGECISNMQYIHEAFVFLMLNHLLKHTSHTWSECIDVVDRRWSVKEVSGGGVPTPNASSTTFRCCVHQIFTCSASSMILANCHAVNGQGIQGWECLLICSSRLIKRVEEDPSIMIVQLLVSTLLVV